MINLETSFCFPLVFVFVVVVVFSFPVIQYSVQPRYDDKEPFPYSTPYLIKNTICAIHDPVLSPYKACKIVYIVKSGVIRKSCRREMEGKWCYLISSFSSAINLSSSVDQCCFCIAILKLNSKQVID